MSATRTHTWSSLYEFSPEAAADIIEQFNLSVRGKGYVCTFSEVGHTFEIKCSVQDEIMCVENFWSIMAEYIARYLDQRTETNEQRKVTRIEATCVSDRAIEETDEEPSTTQETASVATPAEVAADSEFTYAWTAADVDQDVANAFLQDSVQLVLEVVGRTFCIAQPDIKQGIVIIGGSDASVILKIVAKLDNLVKHYVRMRRKPEIHLVETEDEDREKLQLKFYRLLDLGKEWRMDRTTLLRDSQTWSWLSQLYVARLLSQGHEQGEFSLITPDLKPLRELDPSEIPLLWKGYTYKCCGDSYHITKMRRDPPCSSASSRSAQILTTRSEAEAVQKWVSEVATERAQQTSPKTSQSMAADSPDGVGPVSDETPVVTTKLDQERAPASSYLRRRRLREAPQSQIAVPVESELAVPAAESPLLADQTGTSNDKKVSQAELPDLISVEAHKTLVPVSELLVAIDQHGSIDDDNKFKVSPIDMTDFLDLLGPLLQPLQPTSGDISPARLSDLGGETPKNVEEYAQGLLPNISTVEILKQDQSSSSFPEDLLQVVSETKTRVFKSTMKQQKEKAPADSLPVEGKKRDDSDVLNGNSSQNVNEDASECNGSTHEFNVRKLNDGVEQALENAVGFRGTVRLEVTIGRILIHKLSNKFAEDSFKPEDWENATFIDAIYENNKNITFTSKLTTSFLDAESIVDLSVNGSRVFGRSPYQSTVYYEFHCRYGEGDQNEFHIDINADTLEWSVTKPTEVLGKIYHHYPKRAWDSRIAVTGTANSAKHEGVAKLLIRSIHIPIGKSTVAITYTVPEKSLDVISVLVKRQTHYAAGSIADDKLALCQTEVQDLHIVHAVGSEGIYRAFAAARSQMVVDNRLWYEFSVMSPKVEEMFAENQEMELGDEASWTPKEITQGNTVESLQQLSRILVTNMDHVGYYNASEQWLEQKESLRDEIIVR